MTDIGDRITKPEEGLPQNPTGYAPREMPGQQQAAIPNRVQPYQPQYPVSQNLTPPPPIQQGPHDPMGNVPVKVDSQPQTDGHGRDIVRWMNGRNDGVEVALTDSVIRNLPQRIGDENDLTGRVILSILAEVLALGERCARLEDALYKQNEALRAQAQKFKTTAQAEQAMQKTAEENAKREAQRVAGEDSD